MSPSARDAGASCIGGRDGCNVDGPLKVIYLTRGSAAPVVRDRRRGGGLLGVKRETLYAYASRGLVRGVPGAAPGARGATSATDLERLKARRDARSGHGPVAAGALAVGRAGARIGVDGASGRAGPGYRGRARRSRWRSRRPALRGGRRAVVVGRSCRRRARAVVGRGPAERPPGLAHGARCPRPRRRSSRSRSRCRALGAARPRPLQPGRASGRWARPARDAERSRARGVRSLAALWASGGDAA